MRVLTVKVDAHEEGPSAVVQSKNQRDERGDRGDRGDRGPRRPRREDEN
jgi:small subunit ribosomal protein S6